MGLFLAFWRRLFGGYDAKHDIFEKRGILMILCILVTFLWEFFIMSNTWWISLIISILPNRISVQSNSCFASRFQNFNFFNFLKTTFASFHF